MPSGSQLPIQQTLSLVMESLQILFAGQQFPARQRVSCEQQMEVLVPEIKQDCSLEQQPLSVHD